MNYIKGMVGGVLAAVLILGGVWYGLKVNHPMGNISNNPIFNTATNASTSIGIYTPVIVFPPNDFQYYARISNTSANTITCILENSTVASSSLVIDHGIIIGANSTTFSGQPSVCFGVAAGCIPYLGQVQCLAKTATTTVGITYK